VPVADLDEIVERAQTDWLSLSEARIFISGGTGYIGRWLLEAFRHANLSLDLDIAITVLSRDPAKFLAMCPYLRDGEITYIKGDVRDFAFPEGQFTHVIHAATDVIAEQTPLHTFDVTTSGTRRVLEFCQSAGVQRVLLLSSGAVYGRIPPECRGVPETYLGCPDLSSPKSAYGIGKVVTEWLGSAYSAESEMACSSARVFAQVGPHLALDKQFAAGNFILNALNNEPFIIRGDGTPCRSYMYATDLVRWLLAILVRGRASTAYNVGSDESISIEDLAKKIALLGGIPTPDIRVALKPTPGQLPECYVPDISRARSELGVDILVSLDEAFTRTIDWYRQFN
jgi:dTDP-glucose 4,6-dehydratase